MIRGRGLVRLGLGTLALWPVALAGWLGASWSRHRLARPERVKHTLAGLGIDTRGRRIACRRLGHGEMNAVLLVTIDDTRIVLKHTLRFGTFLGWAARELGAMREYPRTLGRAARHAREVRALDDLRRAGVPAPRCLASNDREHVIALEWIDGPDLAAELARRPGLAADLGRLLARIHGLGFALGDANPRNFAVTGDQILPFDLEVSHVAASSVQQGFDLAWAAAFLPDDAARAALFTAYGPRGAALDTGIEASRAHLERYWPLVDLFARRWRAA